MYPNIMVNRYSMWMGTMRVRAASLHTLCVPWKFRSFANALHMALTAFVSLTTTCWRC